MSTARGRRAERRQAAIAALHQELRKDDARSCVAYLHSLVLRGAAPDLTAKEAPLNPEIVECRECGTRYPENETCPEGCIACATCGCTQNSACPGSCSWISMDPPICSRCGPL